MKNQTSTLKLATLLLAALLLMASCVSSTMINSNPPGAQVIIDDQPVGTTPYAYSDNNIIGNSTRIRLEKEGYAPYYTLLIRDEEFDAGPFVAGFFLTPVLWLWMFKYHPQHTYNLEPLDGYVPDSPDMDEPVDDYQQQEI